MIHIYANLIFKGQETSDSPTPHKCGETREVLKPWWVSTFPVQRSDVSFSKFPGLDDDVLPRELELNCPWCMKSENRKRIL